MDKTDGRHVENIPVYHMIPHSFTHTSPTTVCLKYNYYDLKFNYFPWDGNLLNPNGILTELRRDISVM